MLCTSLQGLSDQTREAAGGSAPPQADKGAKRHAAQPAAQRGSPAQQQQQQRQSRPKGAAGPPVDELPTTAALPRGPGIIQDVDAGTSGGVQVRQKREVTLRATRC